MQLDVEKEHNAIQNVGWICHFWQTVILCLVNKRIHCKTFIDIEDPGRGLNYFSLIPFILGGDLNSFVKSFYWSIVGLQHCDSFRCTLGTLLAINHFLWSSKEPQEVGIRISILQKKPRHRQISRWPKVVELRHRKTTAGTTFFSHRGSLALCSTGQGQLEKVSFSVAWQMLPCSARCFEE